MVGEDGPEAVSAHPEVAAALQFTRPYLPQHALMILPDIFRCLRYWCE
jgi:hypothetical protein